MSPKRSLLFFAVVLSEMLPRSLLIRKTDQSSTWRRSPGKCISSSSGQSQHQSIFGFLNLISWCWVVSGVDILQARLHHGLHNVLSGTEQTRKATRQNGYNNMIFCAA